MYEVKHFAEERLEVQHALIQKHPLGLLICNDSNGRFVANPIPFSLVGDSGELGTLKAHLARANPQWLQLQDSKECLVVFQGEEAYVSPNWYPTKHEHGKVVPTWNYVTVHVWGVPAVFDDPDWIRSQIDHLTDQQEADQLVPWKVDDAPSEFTSSMLKGIVGIEVTIEEIQGKWKVSQNRSVADIEGVHAGLTALGKIPMADQVAQYLGNE